MDEFSYDDYWQSLSADCQAVIKQISRSVTHKEFSDKSRPSDKQWGGRIYWDYISSYGKSSNENAAFRNEIDQYTKCNYETINAVSKQGLGEKNARVAFCFSAYISHKYLKKTTQEFILEFFSYSNKRPSSFDFSEITNNIDSIQSEFELIKNKDILKNIENNDERISTVSTEDSWLSPYNDESIPFIGREFELNQLNDFVASEQIFSVWGICAPSGSGKTRLMAHWALHSEKLNGWNFHILEKHDRANPSHWNEWLPDRPTVIVVDYMYTHDEVIKTLTSRFSGRAKNTLTHKIRVLVLDHVFESPLFDDQRWGLIDSKRSYELNRSIFFHVEPMPLGVTKDQDLILREIIRIRSGLNENDQRIKSALSYLKKIKSAWNPLFAALAGDSIKCGRDFSNLDRRDLITSSLGIKSESLLWEGDFDLHKIWASSLVVTATVKGGVSSSTFKKVQNSFPKEAIPDDILKVIKLCKKISPSSKSEYIFPITPDLLGESFFLLFINRMDDIKWMRASLEGLLFHELSENDDDYVEFFEFLIRLIRNMMNDNHDSQFFNKSRGNLAEFLRSISLKGNKKYKFAASMALMNLICMSNDEGFISSYNYFLHPPYFNKYDCYFFTPQQFIVFIIDTLDSYSKKNKHDYNHFDYPELITNCVLNSAPVNAYNKYKKSSRYQYLKFNIPSRVINKTFGDQIFYNDELWLRAVSSLDGADNILDSIIKYQKDTKSDYLQNAGLSPLICAIISGNPEAVDFLLQYMNRYELEGNIGSAQYTPLLLACELGDIEIVKSLVNKGANYNIRDSDGYSPLMLSLLHEHENITLYLLEHEIEIDEPNNKSFTELMLSCRVGNVIAAEMLLAKSADIDKTNDRKDTPIMIASYSGHYDIVELLIKNGARLKEVNSDGDSACELALNNNFTDIASLITLHSESEV